MTEVVYDLTYFDNKTLTDLNVFMDKYNAHSYFLPVIEDYETKTDYEERLRQFHIKRLKNQFKIKSK